MTPVTKTVVEFKQTEAQFQDAVANLAKLLGWRRAHFRSGLAAKGYRTPVQYDGAGYPDLTLVRPPRVVFAEMKSQTGRLSETQREWLADLAACPGIESYVWRPGDWFDIELILARDPEQLSMTVNSTGATFSVVTDYDH
jgi:hypothetical protein